MTNTVEPNLQEYWEIVVRRKWLILSSVAVAMLVASILCVVLPKSYRSMTTVLVEGQKIPESIVQSAVGGTIDERLTSIQQVVMSRSLLTQVAEEFHLFKEDSAPESKESSIISMRKNVKVETIDSSGARGRSIEAFSISFSHEDPMTAMRVTERFASQFIEQNLKIREQLVEGASDFLEQELGLAKEKLETQEKLISQFKTKNIGELPQQIEANLRSLDRIQLELGATSEGIQNLSGRLSGIEKQINEYKVTGRTSSMNEGGQTNQGRTDPLISRLVELERTLAGLKAADYKDSYPDVASARQEIETVKGQLAEKYGVSKEEVKQDSVSVFDPILKELIRQRENTRIELGGLVERERRLGSQKKQFEGRVERTPAHEQDLMILVRDYENTQRNYQSLLEKKLNARVAGNLEKRQKGEQFRIIDPANLPVAPEKPNRPLILLGGLAIGCGLGFGSAFAIELLRPAIRRPEEAEGFLGFPILATIPSFTTLLGAKRSLPVFPARSRQTALAEKKWKGLLSSNGKEGRNGSSAIVLTNGASHQDERSWNLVSKWWPNSMITEQYRVAVTRLALMSSERKHPVILITSSVMGEGKSTTAVNLGHVFAQALDRKTLIIDCDLKRPAVSKYLAMPPSPGLTDYWAGTHTIDQCLHKIGDIPLWVLPTGTPSEKTIELSKVRQLQQLLDEIRPRFDQILLDTPPVFPLADLNFLSRMADGIVFVILAGKTRREVVKQAVKTLGPQCEVGIILAGVESMSMPYYYQCHYDGQAGARYVEEK
jgi:polysaccharide biosynthesis transport protein